MIQLVRFLFYVTTLVAKTRAVGWKYSASEGRLVESSVSESHKDLIINQNTTFSITLTQPLTEPEAILPIAKNPTIVNYPLYVYLSSNQTGFQVPVTCLQAGNCLFSLESDHNESSISNLDSTAFTVSCFKSQLIIYLCFIAGWGYFAVWSFVFYPQYYIIVRDRTVEGFSISYLILNTIGQVCHSVYNVSLFYIPSVQTLFFEQNPQSQIPLELNDVCYSAHALLFCIATFPLFYFFRKTFHQKIELWVKLFVLFFVIYITGLTVLLFADKVGFIDYLIYVSYVKLAVTVLKHFPQITLNYRRKSTRGFSIIGANAHFLGCILSITQSVLLAYNNDDWKSLLLNPTKNLLAVFGVLLDIVYNWQHFVLYGRKNAYVILDDDLGNKSWMQSSVFVNN